MKLDESKAAWLTNDNAITGLAVVVIVVVVVVIDNDLVVVVNRNEFHCGGAGIWTVGNGRSVVENRRRRRRRS